MSTEYSYSQYVHWFDCDTCGEPIEIESHQKVLGECIICHATDLPPNILLIERNEGESDYLKDLLESSDESGIIDTLHILVDDLPTTALELCVYNEVILVNIANADMPEGFDEILDEYVHDFGGNMLTVGGSREDNYGDIVPNAYNREDMYGTLYQEMLPVQAINYTPPLGVVFIIDTSGSMTVTDDVSGKTYLDLAKASIEVGLDALTARDFVGIVTLDSEATTILPMTARTQESTIRSAINSLEANGGGTVYSSAIQQAGMLLLKCKGLAKYHIIMITDGMPSDSAQYPNLIEENHKYGITFSVIGINMYTTSTEYKILQDAVQLGNGRVYNTFASDLPDLLRDELSVPEIREVHYEQFYLQIHPEYALLYDIEGVEFLTLDGFYGTKLKDDATAILTGIYDVPIYAQWDYGNGNVGSFMCDLNMVWSESFMSSGTGQQIILNIVYSLIE